MGKLVLLLTGCIFMAAISPMLAQDPAPTTGKSVREFLSPDGTFDLEVARQSGYQGPLDIDGFQSAIDPATGQPMFQPPATDRMLDDPEDIYWDHSISPGVPPVPGFVRALAFFKGKLIAAGEFRTADSIVVNYIASWDGVTWAPLGTGMNSSVSALAVYNDRLIAGGSFTTAGSIPMAHIAAWDGTSWSPLGSGVESTYVQALAVYGDKLIVGGLISRAGGAPANNIASWDGSTETWAPLGAGITGSGARVYALAVYQNNLIAAGVFSTAGGVSAESIASWDSTMKTWSPLGPGITGARPRAWALTVYDGKLIVGGEFTDAGGGEPRCVAAWDGSSWSHLGTGMAVGDYSAYVLSFTIYHNELIAVGRFDSAGGVAALNVAAWDGSSWAPLGSGINEYITAVLADDTTLFVGGHLDWTGDGILVSGIAEWNGAAWSPLRWGLSGTVFAAASSGDSLFVGGQFNSIGCAPANNIALWNGHSWSSLGSGIEGEYGMVDVYCLTTYEGRLIAGGSFTTAGGVPATNIAAWDGYGWAPLGTGIDDYDQVLAFTVYEGNLIVGGTFTHAGGITVNHIASWDGTTWSPLNSGMPSTVEALTVYNGKLIAGGAFTSAGGTTAKYIASWNGHDWAPLGSGMNGEVCALTVFNGRLVAGGQFTTAGDSAANKIASWDGSHWSPLGIGIGPEYGSVASLTSYDGRLIAGGYFTTAGDTTANNIAAWDGNNWSPLGSGTDNTTNALAIYDGTMVAGGDFTTAGNRAAAYLAQWTKDYYMCGDANGDGKIHVGDAVYLVAYLFRNGPAPNPMDAGDANCDGKINVGDAVWIVSYVFRGGPAPCCP